MSVYEVPRSNMPFSLKFTEEEIKNWMKMAVAAKTGCECLSRQIGVVIVDPKTKTLVSCGKNGPDVSRCDDAEYLRDVVWPQLTMSEKCKAFNTYIWPEEEEAGLCERFADKFGDCGQCPRKIIGAVSGQRLELCTCVHGETAAIVNAHRSVAGCWMFCSCSVPCLDCTKLIIKAKIRTVVAVDAEAEKDYSPYSSRWLFKNSGTDLILLDENWLN